MKLAARCIALLALVATILPAVWFVVSAGGAPELARTKTMMLYAMVVWFVAATLWLWPSKADAEAAPEPTGRVSI